MLGLRLLFEFADKVGVLSMEQCFCRIVLKVHSLSIGQVLAVTVLRCESDLHLIGVIPHELLDNCALTRAGVSSLVDALKKWGPGEGVATRTSRCGVVREPLLQTLKT